MSEKISYNVEKGTTSSSSELWNKDYLEDNENPYFSEAATSEPLEISNTSPSFACRFYIHELERSGKMPDIIDYLEDSKNRKYIDFSSEDEIDSVSASYVDSLHKKLTNKDCYALRNYTGYQYKYINQVSRGFWNYDLLGKKTPEREAEARQAADAIDVAISKSPAIGFDFYAYRGTNLDSFRNYKVETTQDLLTLEGQFFLEEGFTSTSMQNGTSFFGRDFDDPLRARTNVEIRYKIPAESRDGAALLDRELSYAPAQQEYLLNRDSLSYIENVELDSNNIAHLDMILIPRSLYENSDNNDDTHKV